MTRNLLLVTAFLGGAIAPADAGTTTQKKDAAALEIRWDAEQPKLALSDWITVTLTIEGDEPLRVIAPLELASDAKWQLVTRSGEARAPIGKGRERWSLSYRFAPREPGKLEFTFPDVNYREKTGENRTVSWTPVRFTVAAPGQTELRDITGVEAPVPIPPPDRTWPIVGGVVGICALLGAVAFGLRRAFRRRVSRTQADLALVRLQRLLGQRLPEQDRCETFVTLLTLIVRRYLERELALPARRRTSPEFVHVIESCQALTIADKQFLTNFFVRCDAVKFAASAMSVDECARWAKEVRQFVTRIAKPQAAQAGQARQRLPVEKFGQSG